MDGVLILTFSLLENLVPLTLNIIGPQPTTDFPSGKILFMHQPFNSQSVVVTMWWVHSTNNLCGYKVLPEATFIELFKVILSYY